jgi:hypothetical protein
VACYGAVTTLPRRPMTLLVSTLQEPAVERHEGSPDELASRPCAGGGGGDRRSMGDGLAQLHALRHVLLPPVLLPPVYSCVILACCCAR